jgi:ATP-dependent Lon protease
LGMSNLLPNVGMTVEEGDSDLIFKINGLSTVSHNRQAILQSVVEDSQTIDYPSLKKMDKKAIRAFFKEARITYVYHDWMDAIDDKKVTEHEAFNVTEKALEDINWVIQKVVGEVRIMNMIVTSDHGFLYVPDKLEEKDRETLEKLNYLTATKAKEEKKDDEKATTDFVILEPSVVPKQVRIMDNQTGVSYRGLFGDYMKGATKIQLTDPYIRLPYQFRNLMEFCMLLDELKDEGDEMGLHLVTWNDEEHKPQSIESLKDVQETLSEIGINFTYDMQDLHDRSIMTDNGWKVLLGRGLDVFERANGRFNVAEFDQRKRKWKNCEITFIRI